MKSKHKMLRISLCFETALSVVFKVDDFEEFDLWDVTESYNMYWPGTSPRVRYHSNGAMFQIKASANNLSKYRYDDYCQESLPFTRIVSYPDICSVVFGYKNKKRKDISVPWESDGWDNYFNYKQYYRYEKNGNLTLYFGKNPPISEPWNIRYGYLDDVWCNYFTENRPVTFDEWKVYVKENKDFLIKEIEKRY